MKLLVAIALLSAACAETMSVTIAPTTPEVHASSPVPQLTSKQIHVVNGVRTTLASRDGVASSRASAATTAVEAALLGAGWRAVARDEEPWWSGDDRADDARLVIRAVTGGVDLAHPLDGCHQGPHFYGYWVDIEAELIDADGNLQWVAEVGARTTDLLELTARATAERWTGPLCDRLIDAERLATLFADIACDDFTANRCDPGARLPLLVELAAHQLVNTLVMRARITD
jgi:hypothetical protein